MTRKQILHKARKLAKPHGFEICQVMSFACGMTICLVDRKTSDVVMSWTNPDCVLRELQVFLEKQGE